MRQNKNLLRSIIPGMLFAVAVALGFFLIWQNKSLKIQTRDQRLLIARQSQLIDSLGTRSLSNLMPGLMRKIDDELKDNPKRTLSDETISMMAALSHSLRPYAYTVGDSLSTKKLSPERGQLLMVLSGLNIDPGSFHQIMEVVTFASADLREVNLLGVDLSGINLSEADLSSAILDSANLAGVNLSFANLWGVKLNKVNLNKANLRGADLRWSELNEADLRGCDLYESDLSSAQLKKADLRGAQMKYTNLNSAFLNGADLTGADMFRATMVKAQLVETNFSETNLSIAIFRESNLSGAILTDAYGVELEWFIRLNEINVTGAQEMKNKYEMVTEDVHGRLQYKLKRREK